MRVEHLSGNVIPLNWGWMEQLLRPALALDSRRSAEEVREQLISGRLVAFTLSAPNAAAILIIEISEASGRMTCWLYALAGKIEAAPKRWLRIIRDGLSQIEDLARDAGVYEIKLGGRNWPLPGYEADPGVVDVLRKVL